MNPLLQTAVDVMNEAWKLDPLAVRAMLINVIPCNVALADHPHILVDKYDEGYVIRELGLINGILEAMGLGRVAAKWSDTADAEGKYTFLGFTSYSYPE